MSDFGNKAVMAKNIQRFMNQMGKSRNQICDDLGFKYTTFTDWINGKTYPRIDKIEMMANYFGISKADLVESPDKLPAGAVPYNPTHRIPILGQISAGLPLLAEQNIEGYVWTELNHGGEYFALRIKGDSMNAIGINDGYLIIVRQQPEVENGEVAVVMVGDEDATVKRFYHMGRTVTLMPQSTNPSHEPQVYDLAETQIRVLGKVVQVSFSL